MKTRAQKLEELAGRMKELREQSERLAEQKKIPGGIERTAPADALLLIKFRELCAEYDELTA